MFIQREGAARNPKATLPYRRKGCRAADGHHSPSIGAHPSPSHRNADAHQDEDEAVDRLTNKADAHQDEDEAVDRLTNNADAHQDKDEAVDRLTNKADAHQDEAVDRLRLWWL